MFSTSLKAEHRHAPLWSVYLKWLFVFSDHLCHPAHLAVYVAVYMCMCSQSFVYKLAGRLGKILFKLESQLKLPCSSVSQEMICVGWQRHDVLWPHFVPLHVSFSHLSLERGTVLSESGIWTGSGWPFVHSPRRKQAVLIPWYCMFIKCNHRYKQENAIVPSRKWSRNTGGPQTMDWSSFLHCESVGQKKAHCSRVKIGEIIVWFTLPPRSLDPGCGPYWQWPIWRREEA